MRKARRRVITVGADPGRTPPPSSSGSFLCLLVHAWVFMLRRSALPEGVVKSLYEHKDGPGISGPRSGCDLARCFILSGLLNHRRFYDIRYSLNVLWSAILDALSGTFYQKDHRHVHFCLGLYSHGAGPSSLPRKGGRLWATSRRSTGGRGCLFDHCEAARRRWCRSRSRRWEHWPRSSWCLVTLVTETASRPRSRLQDCFICMARTGSPSRIFGLFHSSSVYNRAGRPCSPLDLCRARSGSSSSTTKTGPFAATGCC